MGIENIDILKANEPEELNIKEQDMHCPNGHLIFHTLNGSGCLNKNCPYYVKP